MAQPKRMRFYLEDTLRQSAAARSHNFLNLVAEVLEDAGFQLSYHPNTNAERIKAQARGGFALCHMTPPPSDRALVFRRVYHYPFWQIQRSDQRWDWDVAQASFDPATCPGDEAQRFYGYWRKRIGGTLLDRIGDDGFIYVPLQGRLTDHRSFQSCSPIDMIARTRAACPDRDIVATLHPKEVYSDADLGALDALDQADPHLTVRMGDRDALLPRCSFVVTQNSSVAFDAMFFGKPAVHFARSDFHHIALGPDAFDRVADHRPDFARYVWWLWQHMAINAGHDNAKNKIRAKLAHAGWPVE
ncbi:MAG: hypothetical protein AAFN94_01980 [Pseudomonadota bacterium]